MASAHYFFRNYDIKTILNLMCYMTEYPHTLTSGQKITRLYRYPLINPAASSGDKRNGTLTKIGWTLSIITAIFKSPEKNLNLSSPFRKVQLFLDKPSNTSRTEWERRWTPLWSSTIRASILPITVVPMFGPTRNWRETPSDTITAEWSVTASQVTVFCITLTSPWTAKCGTSTLQLNMMTLSKKIHTNNDRNNLNRTISILYSIFLGIRRLK